VTSAALVLRTCGASVPKHLAPNDGGKHAYLQSGLRMRIRRSLDGLQRRFAPRGSIADQRGSDEIDGCGQFDSGPVGRLGIQRFRRLGSSRLGVGTRCVSWCRNRWSDREQRIWLLWWPVLRRLLPRLQLLSGILSPPLRPLGNPGTWGLRLL
jgi:hypothetical protein